MHDWVCLHAIKYPGFNHVRNEVLTWAIRNWVYSCSFSRNGKASWFLSEWKIEVPPLVSESWMRCLHGQQITRNLVSMKINLAGCFFLQWSAIIQKTLKSFNVFLSNFFTFLASHLCFEMILLMCVFVSVSVHIAAGETPPHAVVAWMYRQHLLTMNLYYYTMFLIRYCE